MATNKRSARSVKPATGRPRKPVAKASLLRRPTPRTRAVTVARPDRGGDAARLAACIDGDTCAIDTATTPPLDGLTATKVKHLVLGAKVKQAPGLVEFLETSKTARYLRVHATSLLAPAPRQSRLEALAIDGATTRDLRFLAGWTQLEALTVGARQTSLPDFAGIAACPKLQKLKAKQHHARSLKPLAALKQLDEFVGPMAKHLTSLDGLGQASLLHVDVNLSPIRDLAPLAGAARLLALKVRGAKLTSIAPILGCRRLQTLYAERSALASIDGIGKHLKDLRLLWIGDTKVEQIDALAGLDRLLDLDLTGLKRVRDFSVLARLRKLRYLNLFDTGFDDVAVLEALPALVQVQLGRTKVALSDPRVKRLNVALKKRGRGGGVLFAPTGAATSLSNSDAAYCSTSWDDATAHNCF